MKYEQGTSVDAYDRAKTRYSEKILFRYQFIYIRVYKEWLGIEAASPSKEQVFQLTRVPFSFYKLCQKLAEKGKVFERIFSHYEFHIKYPELYQLLSG